MSIADEIMKDIEMGKEPPKKKKNGSTGSPPSEKDVAKDDAASTGEEEQETVMNEAPPVDLEHLDRLPDGDAEQR